MTLQSGYHRLDGPDDIYYLLFEADEAMISATHR